MDSKEDSWILVQVEDGYPYFEDAGGTWCSKKGRLEYILEGDDIRNEIEMHEDVQERIKDHTKLPVFQVRLNGVAFVVEEGGWDLDYGYMFPCAHIECDSVEIIELEGS
jgi:hypothetical protein